MICAHHAVDNPVVYEVCLAGAGSDSFPHVHMHCSWLLESSVTALLHEVWAYLPGMEVVTSHSVVTSCCLPA